MQRQQRTAAVDPQDLGQQYGLGNFQARYEDASSHGWRLLVAIAIPVFVSTPFLLAKGQIPAVALLLIAAVLFLLVPLIRAAHKKLSQGNPITFLYKQGFIDCFSKGEVVYVVRWVDIESFVHRVKTLSDAEGGTNYIHSYTITCRGMDRPIALRPASQSAIQSAVADHLYPSIRAAYVSGEACHFGRLDVSQGGLYDTQKKTTFPWNEVKSIRINDNGTMRIETVGQRPNRVFFDSRELKNLAVLVKLVEADVPHSTEFRFPL